MRIQDLTPDTLAVPLTSVLGFPWQQEKPPMLKHAPRLLDDSPGESPVQEEGISAPEPDPRGRRHKGCARLTSRKEEAKHGWSSCYQHLLPTLSGFPMAFLGSPRLPRGLPGGVPSFLMAFLGESPASPGPSWGAHNNGSPLGNLIPASHTKRYHLWLLGPCHTAGSRHRALSLDFQLVPASWVPR